MRRFYRVAAILVACSAVPTSSGALNAQAPPVGATAKCADGTYSKAQNKQGACSHHGGVAQWYGTGGPAVAEPAPAASAPKATSPPAAAKAVAPSDATAQCNDGTYSKSQHRSGTCSHHGGVKQWLKELPN